ncbi:MAG: M23 family metallopeptidase [Candidatus Peribacteraceae bacterium]|nr:M23 family metallopeptidase [Candidatus Peribacteraceae bacterium]
MIFSPLPGRPLITQGFGQNPDMYAAFGLAGHNGIDFGVAEGTTVYAPHDGTITVKDEGTQGYGLSITIDDGKRRSLLAHLSQAKATNGQNISQGDPIGLSGKTGNCTGPHLHWTFRLIKNGQVQNKDNGFDGAMDVTECTRLWQEQSLHSDAEYADTAQDYLAMTFPSNQYIKRPV